MGLNIGVLYFFLLVTILAIDARDLHTINFISEVVGKSDELVLKINHQDPKREIGGSSADGKNDIKVCKLCEEFAEGAQKYLAENKTKTEIMKRLYKSCSNLLSFKQQCVTLVDYYAPIFFLEISSMQPRDFCKKFNLCETPVFSCQRLPKNICGLCHNAVTEVLLMLKNPDTQLEVVELLLKACDSVKSYEEECKKVVFEYVPVVFDDAEELLEGTDVCILLHVCHNNMQPYSLPIPKSFTLLSKLF